MAVHRPRKLTYVLAMVKTCCLLGLLVFPIVAAATETTSVVVLPVRGSVPAETREVIGDLVAVTVSRLPGKTVVTHEDVEAQLSNERMKDAIACDQTSCAAEIAGALGARYLLVSKARTAGADLLITLSVIDTTTQRVTRGQAQQANDSKNFARMVTIAVHEAFGLPPPVVGATTDTQSPSPSLAASGSGKIVFEDKFADARNGWKLEDGPQWSNKVVGGRYVMDSKSDYCAFDTIVVPELLPESFDLVWTSRWESGIQTNAYGVLLGTSRTDFYQFGASGNGQTVVWAWLEDKAGPVVMPWRAESARVGDGSAVNEHRVEVRGKYVSYFTNGKLLTRFPSTLDLRAGLVGIRACGIQRASIGPVSIIAR